MSVPTLRYLVFDASDDALGRGSWEAVASVRTDDAAQGAALRAEVAALLAFVERRSPGPRGPEEEGGVWDVQVDETAEPPWLCIVLTLTGPWDWGEALLRELGAAPD